MTLHPEQAVEIDKLVKELLKEELPRSITGTIHGYVSLSVGYKIQKMFDIISETNDSDLQDRANVISELFDRPATTSAKQLRKEGNISGYMHVSIGNSLEKFLKWLLQKTEAILEQKDVGSQDKGLARKLSNPKGFGIFSTVPTESPTRKQSMLRDKILKETSLDKIKEILDKSEQDINGHNCDGLTLLSEAVKAGRHELVMYLIEERGAKVNHFNHNSELPLHHAIRNNDPDMVQLLLDKSADPMLRVLSPKSKDTPLAYAIKYGNNRIIHQLSCQARNNLGRNPLEKDRDLFVLAGKFNKLDIVAGFDDLLPKPFSL